MDNNALNVKKTKKNLLIFISHCTSLSWLGLGSFVLVFVMWKILSNQTVGAQEIPQKWFEMKGN